MLEKKGICMSKEETEKVGCKNITDECDEQNCVCCIGKVYKSGLTLITFITFTL